MFPRDLLFSCLEIPGVLQRNRAPGGKGPTTKVYSPPVLSPTVCVISYRLAWGHPKHWSGKVLRSDLVNELGNHKGVSREAHGLAQAG